MTQLPVIIGVVLAIALVLGFAVLAIRRGAKAEERAKQERESREAAERVAKAAVDGPRDPRALADELRRGGQL